MGVSLLRSVCIRYRQKRPCTVGLTFAMVGYLLVKIFLILPSKRTQNGGIASLYGAHIRFCGWSRLARVSLWVSIPGITGIIRKLCADVPIWQKTWCVFQNGCTYHLLCYFVRYGDTNIVIINYANRPLAFSSIPQDGANFSVRIILFQRAGRRSPRCCFRIRPCLSGGFVSVSDQFRSGIL